MSSSRQFVFGDFRLDADQRAMFRNGNLVPLAPKALETLLFLVQRHGRIVDKKELMDAVWPETFVEEVSLARNVSILRKVLSESEEGQSFIETIPKRGYRFVAPVTEDSDPPPFPPVPQATSSGAIPFPSQPVLGSVAAKGASRFRFWLLAFAAALVCLATVAYWLTYSRPALSFVNRDWVLISDFENRTGNPRFDKALLTALTVSLEQSRYANIFPRSSVYNTLQRMGRPLKPGEELTIDETLGREICQRENLRALFEAGLTRTGKEYLLTGRLVDPKTGVAVRSYSAKIASEDQILDALDKLAQNVRRDLGETLYSIRRYTRPLPQITTSSLTALQLYAEASDLWTKGKYLDAQKQMLEAVRVDPDFAMAHAALGSELYSHILTKPVEGKAEFERALRLSNHVTERERLFIEASFASNRRDDEEAIRRFLAYLQLYPDDRAARFNLAGTFLRMNRCSDALSQYQELLRIDPADANSEINIATCYGNQLKYAEALPHYARAFELSPDRVTNANINREYGFSLLGAGQPEKAREVFALALAKPEWRTQALRSLALLDLYEGRYKDAIAQLNEGVKANEAEKIDLGVARNRSYLATAYLGQGAQKAATAELDQASRLDAALAQAPWVMARVGSVYVRGGDPDGASRVLEKLKSVVKDPDSETRSEIERLEGEILVARGDFSKGIALLQSARVATYAASIMLTLEDQARAYVKAGQPEKAIPLYESLIAGGGGNPLAWEAQQPWLEAHYQLAVLHAAHGNPARAAQLLDMLLGIWKNADPDLPLLLQAKSLRVSLNQQ